MSERRWFQVSLQSLFWLVLVIAMFFAGWGLAERRAEKAIPDVPEETSADETALISGTLVRVKIWERPAESTGTNYSQTIEGGRVDIYDQFIIVTRPSGERTLVRHGYFTDLWFK
jgi:hypothetical protein